MNKRTAQLGFQQRRESIRQGVRHQRAVDFFNVLTGPLLLELTELHLPAHRERLYPPTVVLSMFIKQALEDDGSCQGRSMGGRHNAQRKDYRQTVCAQGLTVEHVSGCPLRW